MRIAVLTFHKAHNCGAMLQAWALKTALEGMGHTVGFPDCNHVGVVPRFYSFSSPWTGIRRLLSWANWLRIQLLSLGSVDGRCRMHMDFLHKHLPEVSVSADALGTVFDAAVFGSDQIWNPIHLDDADAGLFLGETLPDDMPRISYAASRGDVMPPEDWCARLRKAVRKFSALSVRESFSGAGLIDRSGRKPVVVSDPSLLMTRNGYSAIARQCRMRRGRYLLVYTLYPRPFVCECAQKAACALGLPVVILCMYQYGFHKCPKNVKIAFGPAEWLAWIRDAEAVMSMSFHGTVFAAIFGKPFVSVRPGQDTSETRVSTFIKAVGESPCRIVAPGVDSSEWVPLLRQGLNPSVETALARMREESAEWLKSSLDEIVLGQ